MKFVFAHIITLFVFLPGLVGQFQFDNYQFLTTADGIPGTHINAFAEDKHGFIWVGSWSGLARYDGSKFDRIVRLPSDSVFLPSNYITALHISGDSLWIGTYKGLSILDLPTRTFSNHLFISEVEGVANDEASRNYIRDIYEDRQGNIWVAPSFEGFVKWERKTATFKQFPLPPAPELPDVYGPLGPTSLAQIIQDGTHDSIMWAGSYGGIIRFNQETGEMQRILYESADEKTNFNVNRKICLYQDAEGLIYSGSWNSGLSIFDPISKEYFYPEHDFLKNASVNVGEEHLYTIFPKEPGYLYLTYGGEFGIYNTKNHSYQTVKKTVFKGNQIGFGIDFIDSQQRIWYGVARGILVSDPVTQQFAWHSLAEFNLSPHELIPRAVYEGFYPGYISIAGQYSDGLYHINTTSGHVIKQLGVDKKKNEKSFHAWGLTILDKNRLLVSEKRRLYIASKDSPVLKPYELQIPIHYGGNNFILDDGYGKAWTANRNGIFTINHATGQVQSYPDLPHFEGKKVSLKDREGNIWFKALRGHLVYSHKDDQIYPFDYTRDTSRTFIVTEQFCQCPNGEVWVASNRNGIGLLSQESPEKGIIRKFPVWTKDKNRVSVSRLACNQKNELWASSRGGIFKINRNDWTIDFYHIDYGIRTLRDLDLFLFLKNDELIIGERDGVYTVDPNKLKTNTRLPRPYVVNVTSNKGPKNIFQDYLDKKAVKLEPDENVLTITFSAINHTIARKTRYLYMLEGVDEEWMDPGSKRTFTYSYLEGGNYVFKVKAANNEGIWNPEVYELPILVGTPWYKTSLFWILMGLMITGFAYAYYKDRIRQVERESHLKREFDKKVAELEMRALRAQMNPHFIFNCLNSIDAYIIKSDTRKASEYLNNFSRLVRLILQHSRSAYVNLKDELEALELYIKLEQMRFRNSFDYEIVLKDALTPENFEIPPMLIQPFVENAIWHGINYRENGGKVSVQIEVEGDTLLCIIEDNGIGREAAAEIRANKKVKRKSMGMGITTERIEIINNMYQTHNQVKIHDLYEGGVASGTRVILQIPL